MIWPSRVSSALASLRRLDVLGEAEVEHLDAPFRAHHHVGRLQVAVNDAACVRGGKRLGDRHGNREQFGGSKPPGGISRLSGVPSISSIVRNGWPSTSSTEWIVTMFGWFRRRSRALRARTVAVLGVVSLEDFERDVPLEPGVAGAVDLAHAPDTEQGYDFVGAKALAWQQVQRMALRACRSNLRGSRP